MATLAPDKKAPGPAAATTKATAPATTTTTTAAIANGSLPSPFARSRSASTGHIDAMGSTNSHRRDKCLLQPLEESNAVARTRKSLQETSAPLLLEASDIDEVALTLLKGKRKLVLPPTGTTPPISQSSERSGSKDSPSFRPRKKYPVDDLGWLFTDKQPNRASSPPVAGSDTEKTPALSGQSTSSLDDITGLPKLKPATEGSRPSSRNSTRSPNHKEPIFLQSLPTLPSTPVAEKAENGQWRQHALASLPHHHHHPSSSSSARPTSGLDSMMARHSSITQRRRPSKALAGDFDMIPSQSRTRNHGGGDVDMGGVPSNRAAHKERHHHLVAASSAMGATASMPSAGRRANLGNSRRKSRGTDTPPTSGMGMTSTNSTGRSSKPSSRPTSSPRILQGGPDSKRPYALTITSAADADGMGATMSAESAGSDGSGAMMDMTEAATWSGWDREKDEDHFPMPPKGLARPNCEHDQWRAATLAKMSTKNGWKTKDWLSPSKVWQRMNGGGTGSKESTDRPGSSSSQRSDRHRHVTSKPSTPSGRLSPRSRLELENLERRAQAVASRTLLATPPTGDGMGVTQSLGGHPPRLRGGNAKASDAGNAISALNLAANGDGRRSPSQGSRRHHGHYDQILPEAAGAHDAKAGLSHQTTAEDEEGTGGADMEAEHSLDLDAVDRLQAYLPGAEEVLGRLRRGDVQGFDKSERRRMKSTFLRFRYPNSSDVHKEECCAILQHLNYHQVDRSVVEKIATELSEYASMDFNEFVDFMTAYCSHEHGILKTIFEKQDADGEGLDLEGIVSYIASLGYTPMRRTVKENVDLVDLNRDGKLQFEEVALLLHLYRHSEGFTRDEVKRFGDFFEAMLEKAKAEDASLAKERSPCLPPSKLASLLIAFFGPAFAPEAKTLMEELMRREKDAYQASVNGLLGLDFPEALIWARRLRDLEIESYRKAFNATAKEKSTITFEELHSLTTSLGFTLTKEAIEEMISTAKGRGEWKELEGDVLDFDAFVHFMQVLNENDGFTKAELHEIQLTFDKFDTTHCGELDVLELADIMRYLGHPTPMDEMRVLIRKLDDLNRGKLNFRYFARFVRLHREKELALARELFSSHSKNGEPLDKETTQEVLSILITEKSDGGSGRSQVGIDRNKSIMEAVAIEDMAITTPVDLETFLSLAEEVRTRRTVEQRKRAGFSDEELNNFRELFNYLDNNKSGTIKIGQVSDAVQELGFPVETVEDQKKLVKSINEAIDVTSATTGVELPEGQLDFWSLVYLLRGLYRRDDKLLLDKVTRAAEKCNFKANEVADFQQIFLGALDHERRRFGEQGDAEAKMDEDNRTLPRLSVFRLLRGIGLQVDTHERALLDKQLLDLSEHPQGDIAFAEFLLLMRWALDTNFCKIKDVIGSDDGGRSP